MKRIFLTTAVVAAMLIASPAVHALPTNSVWGLTASNELVRFKASTPGTIDTTVAVTGLQGGETLIGIDFRPANGKLYGLSNNLGSARIYVIDPTTGAAHAVSKVPFAPPLVGTAFGFDFNPVVDRIRIVTDGDQNYRVNPDTGVTTSLDTPLAFAAGDVSAGANPNIVASAYSNNVDGAATTTLYNLDSGTDDLSTQNPPNAGTLNTVGSTSADIASTSGFDIDADGNAVVVATIAATSKLYSLDLTTATATLLGQLPTPIIDLAVTLPQPNGGGYVLGASDGGVFPFGTAGFVGSAGSIALNQPVVGIATRSVRQGYWLAASDGGIFNYGDAGFYGSAGALLLNKPVVGIAAHTSNKGYWLVASDGGVFTYGDAGFYGSVGALLLNKPIVAMSPTPTGQGYWLFASDGGVFTYGDAGFYGSAGAVSLNKPVVGGFAAVDGRGYYLVASDGGIFNYGPGAPHLGSMGGTTLNKPIVGMTADLDGRGYTLAASDGGAFNFGSAFAGSADNIALNKPIVGIGGK